MTGTPPAAARAALRPPTLADTARLVAVGAIWGAAFLCIEIALLDFRPLAIAAWRTLLAALVMVPACRLLGVALPRGRRTWGLLALIGWLNGIVPFTLIGWGQQTVDSATTGVLLAASPFATLALAGLLTADERFGARALAGLVLGFVGVLVLIGRAAFTGGSTVGMLAIVLAACCYAVSSLLIRRLDGVAGLAIVAGGLLASALVAVPILLFVHPPWEQAARPGTLGALAALAFGSTALAYVLRTRVVQTNGAVFMSNVGYLIPLFAVLWAWLFRGTVPPSTTWLALALIVPGIALGRARRPRVATVPPGDAR